jgi:hypothetical protein
MIEPIREPVENGYIIRFYEDGVLVGTLPLEGNLTEAQLIREEDAWINNYLGLDQVD